MLMVYYFSQLHVLGMDWAERQLYAVASLGPFYQSGTKPNLVAKILATKIGNLLA